MFCVFCQLGTPATKIIESEGVARTPICDTCLKRLRELLDESMRMPLALTPR